MKKLVIATALSAVVVLNGCSAIRQVPVNPGKQEVRNMKKTVRVTRELNYLLYLPDDYGKSDAKFPLLIFLHGAGERGDNIEKVKMHGPPKLVGEGADLPFIVVSPQCPSGTWWPEKLDDLNCLLDTVIETYDVDTSRVYLTGLSMGGFGTWAWAMRNPERFAAVAPICGGGQKWRANLMKSVPVWAFHGGKDSVVPLSRSENMAEALTKAGGEVTLTVYPEAGHNSWTAAYDTPELFEWFLKHKKEQ